MSSVDDKITLICPTYERRSSLLKSINYWQDSPFNVVFIDGSEFPLASESLPDHLNNVVYLHSPSPLHERLLNAFSKISTPYVLMLNDDERYEFNFVRSSIRFLDDNPDFISCTASSVLVSSRPFPRVVSDSYTLKIRSMALSSDVPAERINSLMSNYAPAHYFSVCRTVQLVQIYRLIYQFIPRDIFALDELVLELLLCATGKNMVSNGLYWMRCSDNPPIRNTGDYFMSTKVSLADLYLDRRPEYSAIVDFVSTHAGVERKSIEAVFFAYLNANYPQVQAKKVPGSSLSRTRKNFKVKNSFNLRFLFAKIFCASLGRFLLLIQFLFDFCPQSIRLCLGFGISLVVLRIWGIGYDSRAVKRMLYSYS